eukprot:TRINITY_DN4741_c3_g1_i1.p3 TRINITY_DN4741_c3_g1~~TRINITY_DN4741_c3_g1_i1.p3  ORF type:complete len:216 (-),score=-12.12 TRINITY_DN4741_c3_g1_i1:670-1317(-)
MTKLKIIIVMIKYMYNQIIKYLKYYYCSIFQKHKFQSMIFEIGESCKILFYSQIQQCMFVYKIILNNFIYKSTILSNFTDNNKKGYIFVNIWLGFKNKFIVCIYLLYRYFLKQIFQIFLVYLQIVLLLLWQYVNITIFLFQYLLFWLMEMKPQKQYMHTYIVIEDSCHVVFWYPHLLHHTINACILAYKLINQAYIFVFVFGMRILEESGQRRNN